MNKINKIQALKKEFTAKRKKYLDEKEIRIQGEKNNGHGGLRSEAQIENDKRAQKQALNLGYAWACKRSFKDPMDAILDQIERNSKGGI